MEALPGLEGVAIERPLVDQLAAGRELLAFMRRSLQRAHGSRLPEPRQLVFAIVARAAVTYEALLTLCEQGFSEQAGMLVRPLFESLVDAHWVRTNPEEAVERLRDHRERVAAMLGDEAEATRGLTDFELASAPGAVGPGSPHFKTAKSHWTGTHQLNKRIKAIGDRFPTLLPGPDLDAFDLEWNRWANWLLHGSSSAFDDVVDRVAPGVALARLGRSDGYRREALFAAGWVAAQLGWLAMDLFPSDSADELGAELDKWVNLYCELLLTLQEVPVTRLMSVSDSDDCPCGSGRQARACHRTPAVAAHIGAIREAANKFRRHLRDLPPGEPVSGRIVEELTAEFLSGFDERQSSAPQRSNSRRGKRRRRR